MEFSGTDGRTQTWRAPRGNSQSSDIAYSQTRPSIARACNTRRGSSVGSDAYPTTSAPLRRACFKLRNWIAGFSHDRRTEELCGAAHPAAISRDGQSSTLTIGKRTRDPACSADTVSFFWRDAIQSSKSILKLLVTLSAGAAQPHVVDVSRNFSVQKHQFSKDARKDARNGPQRKDLRCQCKSGPNADMPAVAPYLSGEKVDEMKRVSGSELLVEKDVPA